MWLAQPEAAASPAWPALPLRLVVVQHTAGAQCHRFADCAAALRLLQQYYLAEFDYDLPYNFLVGNEGRIYEGRGWEGVAPHTLHYNFCALGLGFMGDYAATEGGARPGALQLENAARALRSGVTRGALHARHAVLAARDLQPTASPGDALYEALRRLPNFIADPHRFFNKSCEYIYAELDKIDFEPLPAESAPPDAA